MFLSPEVRGLVLILPPLLAVAVRANSTTAANALEVSGTPSTTAVPAEECCAPRGGRHGRPVRLGAACQWSAQCPPRSACVQGRCRRCKINGSTGGGSCAIWKDRKRNSLHMFRTAMIISASVIAALLGCFIACVITRAFLGRSDNEESIAFASSTATPEPGPRFQLERPPAYTDVQRQQEELPSYVEAMRRPLNTTPRTNTAYVVDIT
ncbi:uncharacterized protein LOC119465219 isoform X2 [Dermacentor silvarum]|uniref:uncharacterized protein LOC119465219 isoform X2 n=1 Tax=Dermacentor silvarum TaxID=543639 RepID=UPI00189754CE|nr:uncharacterized protein LOC119465219 isoform X2 [Dermacentor silvarum]